jgi:predicted SAM-dependent methyltransferase
MNTAKIYQEKAKQGIPLKLNLGSGLDRREGWINLDCSKYTKDMHLDVDHDLNKFPYPFPDNSIDEIYMRHILEHLEQQDKVLAELYRILKPGGTIMLIYPFWNNIDVGGFGHTHVYNQYFINYFITPSQRTKRMNREYSNIRFNLVSEVYFPHNTLFFRKLSNYITSITKEMRWVLQKPLLEQRSTN